MKSSILHKYKIAVAFIAYTATLEVGINQKNKKIHIYNHADFQMILVLRALVPKGY